jgi:uncharacterized membrane protein
MFKLAHIRQSEDEAARREASEWAADSAAAASASSSSSSPSSTDAAPPAASPEERSLVCHPIWLLGAICVGLGAILDLVSFAFASVSLLAPLGAMTLVLNLFMAPLFLKEKLTMYDVNCTLVILAGTIVAICFGNKNNTSYSLEQLIDLYKQTAFLVYVGVFFALLGVSVYFQFRALHRLEHPGDFTEDVLLREHRYVLVYYPSLAGIFGAHSVLGAKSAIEMAKSSISGRSSSDVKSPLFVVFLLVCVVAIYLQCFFLNKGLARGDALFIVPVYQVAWVLMNTVLGMIYFRDWFLMTNLQIGLFCMGVVITLVGVYLLSLREKAPIVTSAFAQSASSVNSGAGSGAEAAPLGRVTSPRKGASSDEHEVVDNMKAAIVNVDDQKSLLRSE